MYTDGIYFIIDVDVIQAQSEVIPTEEMSSAGN